MVLLFPLGRRNIFLLSLDFLPQQFKGKIPEISLVITNGENQLEKLKISITEKGEGDKTI